MLAKAPKLKVLEWVGTTISKPGLYSKIPIDLYHSQKICDGPSVSSSGLRLCFSKSPAHFYDTWSGNPNCAEEEEKDHFVFGRAIHHLILGEANFAKTFAAPPDEYPDAKTGEMKPWTYKATFCKQWRELQEREGKTVLAVGDVAKIIGIAGSISKHSIIKAGALNGLIEHSMFYRDEETGLWVKTRPDAIPTTCVDFVDLKTTTSVLWNDMRSAIAECGYHQQGALIRTAARKVLGIVNPSFSLVFAEKKRPYCVDTVTIKEPELDRGEKQNRYALNTIARCIKSGEWPGPGREDVRQIELPEWAQKQIDDKLEFGIA